LLNAKNKSPDSKAAAGTVIIHAAIIVRKCDRLTSFLWVLFFEPALANSFSFNAASAFFTRGYPPVKLSKKNQRQKLHQ
jgi:hypothetical protein